MALMLAACAGTTSTQVTQYAQDANLIGAGLNGAVAALKADPTVSPATIGVVSTYVAAVQTAAQEVATAASANAAQGPTGQLVQAVNALVAGASGIAVLPPDIRTIFAAASALLPPIEIAVGLAPAAGAAPAAMSPDEARLRLAAAAHR